MMCKFKYLLVVCITVFCVNCSRQANTSKVEDNKDQIALADSILFYLQQEQFDKIIDHLDVSLIMQLNKEQLAVVWAQLNTQVGKFAGSEFYKIEKIDNIGNKVIYKCDFGSQQLYFQLVLGKENRIMGLFFKTST